MDEPFSVVIVGGGLVGSLAAVFFAKRGWNVQLYERRSDPRKGQSESGRSINLALSVRGISALTAAGVEEGIVKTLLPMKGRMIHSKNGQGLMSQPYGIFGECINSVDRMMMNQHLLESAEKLPNVELHFEHDLMRCDFDAGEAIFVKTDGTHVKAKGDLIVGADGAYSRTRQQLMRKVRMDYQQSYIDHAYVELTMPPAKDGGFAMAPDHLHIWPRQTFMMIALPNLDKSFTVTLFMPWSKFESIGTPEELLHFFDTMFPDAVPLIGRDQLVELYFQNPKGSLMSVKCKPYHYTHRALIIGDAAHAMVPFYGQGMNCGMEDCLVFEEILTKHLGPALPHSPRPDKQVIAAALAEYTATRNRDVEDMCDLAMYNYVEMRSSVTRRGYLIRKAVEGWLHWLMPQRVIPLYTMVSFTRIPYSDALRRWRRRTWWFDVLEDVAKVLLIGTATSVGVLALNRVAPGLSFNKLTRIAGRR
ncbi:kynurenine 3-monooxygenase, mitochondrial precursor [Gaertneriomyces sp. JEL0708]|nr:kynurenine 3-monooxygenase, mitochondrial precursor [Gaertneriomyces sp. JEL0708]